jgi:DNA-binding response OmpR family regulator
MNASTEKTTIMLVDDNKRLVIALSDFLNYEGFNVISASSGEDALEKLSEITPDIIILDINMPGIGGVGFLNTIAKKHIDLDCPVLVFTARSAMEDFISTLDVAGFIAKPCSENDLLNKINEILSVSSHHTETTDEKQEKHAASVLIGEDDIEVSSQLIATMQRAGFDYKIVKSGGEMLETAATMKPDIIVLKDILPGMNGRVIVPLLRAMPSTQNIPVILYDDTYSYEQENRYGHRLPEGISIFLRTSEASSIIEAIKKQLG